MMHSDEVRATPDIARRLIADQFPRWSRLPVYPVAADGTVHAIYRIGERLTARFPLRATDPDEVRMRLEIEATAARELADCSPVPTPEPVALGEPGYGYPLPWAVQTWIPGRVATDDDPGSSMAFAADLAVFIGALRAADTRGRKFSGTNRGGDLKRHDRWMQKCFRESAGFNNIEQLRQMWTEFRQLPAAGVDVMSHGDLIPSNILVKDGRLAGILDGGGFGAADPALDLVAAWHLLDDEPRMQLRTALGSDAVEWSRGMAWAFEQAMGLVWYYAESCPALSRMGKRTLDRLANQACGTRHHQLARSGTDRPGHQRRSLNGPSVRRSSPSPGEG
jgi:aminoglycoside phosphotransferase (APT) family kinase protein